MPLELPRLSIMLGGVVSPLRSYHRLELPLKVALSIALIVTLVVAPIARILP